MPNCWASATGEIAGRDDAALDQRRAERQPASEVVVQHRLEDVVRGDVGRDQDPGEVASRISHVCFNSGGGGRTHPTSVDPCNTM